MKFKAKGALDIPSFNTPVYGILSFTQICINNWNNVRYSSPHLYLFKCPNTLVERQVQD